MFGVSLPELVVVFVVLLLVLGPDKLPGAARSLGKAFAVVRKNTDMVRREFYRAVYAPAEEIKRSVKGATQELRTVQNSLLEEERTSGKDGQSKSSDATNEAGGDQNQ